MRCSRAFELNVPGSNQAAKQIKGVFGTRIELAPSDDRLLMVLHSGSLTSEAVLLEAYHCSGRRAPAGDGIRMAGTVENLMMLSHGQHNAFGGDRTCRCMWAVFGIGAVRITHHPLQRDLWQAAHVACTNMHKCRGIMLNTQQANIDNTCRRRGRKEHARPVPRHQLSETDRDAIQGVHQTALRLGVV